MPGDDPTDRADPSGALPVRPDLSIPAGELRWRFTPSGGPGGQHANRSHTRAEVHFDVRASTVLTEAQRRRLLERVGPTVVAAADDERSQARNRAVALERLRRRLVAALEVPKRRRPTRPSRAARQRRVEAKRRRGELKRGRRPSGGHWE